MIERYNSMNTKFIAEVSSNHNADFNRCLDFVHTASRIGCYGIKFQYFKIDKLFHSSALKAKPELGERSTWELPLEFLRIIADECKEYNLKLGVTPFDVKGVKDIERYVDFYKVASYNLLDTRLLANIASTGKPIVIATGMASLPEVNAAVEVIKNNIWHGPITILHCVSDYPTNYYDCNLRAIETLRQVTMCNVGWSDHTVNNMVIERAINYWQASMIEFHLDLDGNGKEYQKGHCWLPHEIHKVIHGISLDTAMDGDGIKQPRPCELEERLWRADPSDGLRPLLKKRAELIYNTD